MLMNSLVGFTIRALKGGSIIKGYAGRVFSKKIIGEVNNNR
jgi:hypothetical protein